MREEVFAVADAIAAEGGTPTQAGVRERIGRGSMSTIAPLLKEWRETRNERAAVAADVIPMGVFSAMDAAAMAVWAAALKEAERVAGQADEARQDAEARLRKALGDLDEARLRLADAEARIADQAIIEKALIKAETERDSLRERLAEARGTITEMRRDEKASHSREVKLTERAATLEERSKAKK